MKIEINEDRTVTVNGTKIAFELLEQFSQQGPLPSPWFRIVKRGDGVVSVETVSGEPEPR